MQITEKFLDKMNAPTSYSCYKREQFHFTATFKIWKPLCLGGFKLSQKC